MKLRIIIFEEIEESLGGFWAVLAMIAGLALLLAATTSGFTWLMMAVCYLPTLLQTVHWGWVALIAGSLLAGQMALAVSMRKNDRRGPLPGSALAVDIVLSILMVLVLYLVEDLTGSFLEDLLLIPLLTILLIVMMYPLASLLTTVTALPTAFSNWRYALGSLCGFLALVGLVLAFQGLIESICGFLSDDLLEMTQLKFTGEWLIIDVTDNAQSMRIGEAAANLLSQMGAGTRFLLFSVVAGLSIWGRLAVGTKD